MTKCTLSSTGGRRDPRKEAFWRRHIQAQGRGGQTLRQYCQAHDLSLVQMGWWRRELRRRDAAVATAFVPVRVTGHPAGASAARLEIVLPGRWRLRLRGGVDQPMLAAVLATLHATREGAPC